MNKEDQRNREERNFPDPISSLFLCFSVSLFLFVNNSS